MTVGTGDSGVETRMGSIGKSTQVSGQMKSLLGPVHFSLQLTRAVLGPAPGSCWLTIDDPDDPDDSRLARGL